MRENAFPASSPGPHLRPSLESVEVRISAERASYERRFVFVWLVVGIDKRGLEVSVTHPFLEGAQWDTYAGHSSSKCVPKVVESHSREAGASGCCLEPLEESRAV